MLTPKTSHPETDMAAGAVRAGDPVRVATQWFRSHPGFRGRLWLRWTPGPGPGWIAVFEWVGGRARWVSCSPAPS